MPSIREWIHAQTIIQQSGQMRTLSGEQTQTLDTHEMKGNEMIKYTLIPINSNLFKKQPRSNVPLLPLIASNGYGLVELFESV